MGLGHHSVNLRNPGVLSFSTLSKLRDLTMKKIKTAVWGIPFLCQIKIN